MRAPTADAHVRPPSRPACPRAHAPAPAACDPAPSGACAPAPSAPVTLRPTLGAPPPGACVRRRQRLAFSAPGVGRSRHLCRRAFGACARRPGAHDPALRVSAVRCLRAWCPRPVVSRSCGRVLGARARRSDARGPVLRACAARCLASAVRVFGACARRSGARGPVLPAPAAHHPSAAPRRPGALAARRPRPRRPAALGPRRPGTRGPLPCLAVPAPQPAHPPLNPRPLDSCWSAGSLVGGGRLASTWCVGCHSSRQHWSDRAHAAGRGTTLVTDTSFGRLGEVAG